MRNDPERRPWLAETIAPLSRPWYIAVDEVGDALASLRITPWPRLDERGRVRFYERERGFMTKAEVAALEDLADLHRSPSRPLRVGDVFAADLADVPDEDGELTELVSGPLIDVSTAAREAAKAQYFAAVAPTLGETDVEHLFGDLMPENG